ncbi:MAG: NTP transferase domain-containing protein [Clostridia bacterium]|nr:NTP transferase domain-containing protein [Clostridia bacterium]
MALHTVIMAGGEGVRLRPLTQQCPKPLAPLCGDALMGYTLRLLRRHGIDQATATLWYRPQDVICRFGEGRHGVKLNYAIEDMPLGTAGSVKRASEGVKDTTLVLSGDGLTGCDLTSALRYHREKGAVATIVLTRVEIPLQYGVVVTQKDGRILRFVEKPDWSRVVGNLVNTGIYILEPEALQLIPSDRPYDFGRELFPRMLKEKLPLFGYEMQDYWCDVGEPAAFLRSQGELLMGACGFTPADTGRRILRDGYISFDSYVSPHAFVAEDAVIENSCILPGARVESGVRMKGSILCAGAYAGRGSVLQEGSVLGAGAQLGAFSRCESARLYAGVRLEPMQTVRGVIADNTQQPMLRGGEAQLCRPEEIIRLAGAFVQQQKCKSVALMHDTDAEASYALWLGAAASFGLQKIKMLGCGTPGMLAYALRNGTAEAGVWIGKEKAYLYGEAGTRLDDQQSTAVLFCARRCETPAVSAEKTEFARESVREQYLGWLEKEFPLRLPANAWLKGEASQLYDLTREALLRCGYHFKQNADTRLTVAGERIYVTDQRLPGGEDQRFLLCCGRLKKMLGEVYDTRHLGSMARDLKPCNEGEVCLKQRSVLEDPLFRALLLLDSIGSEREETPEIYRKEKVIPCAAEQKSRVLEALADAAEPCVYGGMQLMRNGGQAHITVDPVLPLLRISACACHAENAKELCDFCDDRIRSFLEEKEKNGRLSPSSLS